MSAAYDDLTVFSMAALEARKKSSGLTQTEAAEYVIGKHELSAKDVSGLRKRIAGWRRIYEQRYRDVRHKVFAHKALSDLVEVNALLAKTSIAEMKAMFAFLSTLYSALWQVFHNGVQPVLDVRDFVLSSDQPSSGGQPGETIYREGHAVLKSMLPGLKSGGR
jgi:hypothetical protein